MQTREDIYSKLSEIFVDMFDVNEQMISMDAKLYEDLDIDSIDAIDIVVYIRELTGKKIKPEDFKSVRTVSDIVDATYDLLHKG